VGEAPSTTDRYGFDPFAQHPFYAEMNRSLVQRTIAHLDAARPTGELVRIVDLASGTGAVTQHIFHEVERLVRSATVLGIEPASEALEFARKRLQGQAVQFIHGDADQLAHAWMTVCPLCGHWLPVCLSRRALEQSPSDLALAKH
jgi:SAM-dependent methyltransferase